MLLELRGFTATGVSFCAVVSRLTSTTKLDGALALAATLGGRGAVATGVSETQAAAPTPATRTSSLLPMCAHSCRRELAAEYAPCPQRRLVPFQLVCPHGADR